MLKYHTLAAKSPIMKCLQIAMVTGLTHAKLVALTSQALTTPGKIRLPIGQPAGKYQVAPIKSQVAPFCRTLL